MKYKDALKQSMEMLAKDRTRMFIGYNVLYGSRAYGTLRDIPRPQCIETPVAENLMIDLGIGLSLAGFRPVIFIERHDFILNALDAIVNHLDKIDMLSRRQFKAPVIIRATVGAKGILNPGPQHTQDFTTALKTMLSFPVIELMTPSAIIEEYRKARAADHPVMFVERRELYDCE